MKEKYLEKHSYTGIEVVLFISNIMDIYLNTDIFQTRTKVGYKNVIQSCEN